MLWGQILEGVYMLAPLIFTEVLSLMAGEIAAE